MNNKIILTLKKILLNPRYSFLIIFFIAFIALLLGAIQISITLKGGKKAFLTDYFAKRKQATTLSQTIKKNVLNSKYRLDTDKDGLPDFLEKNYYKTSPYLADSDNDGISDGEEVKKGTNPLCGSGTCSSQIISAQQTTGETVATQKEISSFFGNHGKLDEIIQKLESGEINEEQATKMLEEIAKDSGVDLQSLKSNSQFSNVHQLDLPIISEVDIIILETSTQSSVKEYFDKVTFLFAKYPVFEKMKQTENIETSQVDEITRMLNNLFQEGKQIITPKACVEIHKKGLALVKYSKENLEKIKITSSKEEAEKIAQNLQAVSSETTSLIEQAKEIAKGYEIVLE